MPLPHTVGGKEEDQEGVAEGEGKVSKAHSVPGSSTGHAPNKFSIRISHCAGELIKKRFIDHMWEECRLG